MRTQAYLRLLLVPLFLAPLGCGSDPARSGDELTSNAAVERTLKIKGYVYVAENASSYSVKSAVKRQVRTAFGPLRIAKISVDDREFANNIDPATFSKKLVKVVEEVDGEKQVVETVAKVSYAYTARALVAKQHAQKSQISFALLMGYYQSFVDDIIHDCVENYEHDSEFASSFWYVWAPAEYACKQRISDEVEVVNESRAGLEADEISKAEHERRFLPVTAELEQVDAPPTTYPEYDRLYGLDDESKRKVVVYSINGTAAHDGDPASEIDANDYGFAEFFKQIDQLSQRFEGLRVAESSEVDPLHFTFEGVEIEATFADLYKWTVDRYGFPAEIESDKRDAFRHAIFELIDRKWIVLEAPIVVNGGRVAKRMVLEFHLLYGISSGWNVRDLFRTAFTNADVVLYNGHSYIGSGPLDPSNYGPQHFNDRYQILFFNSCVSFNYYSVDYFDHKQGGSQNLDLVTNGIEVYISKGGKGMGQFLGALFDGEQHSWLELLKRTRVSWWGGYHDPNRVVDGELDNQYVPTDKPIAVEAGSWEEEPEEPGDELAFADDVEQGAGGWIATGLWHIAGGSACAAPGYASATHAWYFGDDEACSYEGQGRSQGTLTSPTIRDVSSSSTLSFSFFREVEHYADEQYDKTTVEVAVAGSDSWTAVWTRDSSTESAGAWSDSGPISLEAFAGQEIQVRFVFDSIDDYANDHVGWLIDDIRVTK